MLIFLSFEDMNNGVATFSFHLSTVHAQTMKLQSITRKHCWSRVAFHKQIITDFDQSHLRAVSFRKPFITHICGQFTIFTSSEYCTFKITLKRISAICSYFRKTLLQLACFIGNYLSVFLQDN